MKSKEFYEDIYQLLTMDETKVSKEELEKAFNLLRKIYAIKDMQVKRMRQLYTMIREYGHSILSIDRLLECDELTLEEAYDYLNERILEEGYIRNYDTEL